MKEAAIAAAKDRSKGELRLRQRQEDARRLEGAAATTTTRTEGVKCSRRVVEPRLRVVEEAEGRAEAVVAAVRDRQCREHRVGARRLPRPLAAGGRR